MANELRTDFIFNDRDSFKVDLVHKKLVAVNNDFNNLGKNSTFGRTIANDFGLAGKSADAFGAKTKNAFKIDEPLKKAQADIRNYQLQNIANEKLVTKAFAAEAKSQADTKIKEFRRADAEAKKLANDFLRSTQGGRSSGFGGGDSFGSAFGSRAFPSAFSASSAAGFAGGLAGGAAVIGITTTTNALREGGSAWLDYSSKIEQAHIAMTTLTGSQEKANVHIKELQNFAKNSPFRFEETLQASRQIQAVGIEGKRVIPILTAVGNALAASGKLDSLPFAVKALTDIQAKGKLAGQEIIQLANAGLPIRDVLAKQLGVSSAEIVKLGENGRISSDVVFAALQKMSSERFGDAMANQSKTFAGSTERIKDSLLQISEEGLKPLFVEISQFTTRFADNLNSEQDKTKNVFRAFGETLGQSLREGMESGSGNKETWLQYWLRGGIGTDLVSGYFKGVADIPVPQRQTVVFDDLNKDGSADKVLNGFKNVLGDERFLSKIEDFTKGIKKGTSSLKELNEIQKEFNKNANNFGGSALLSALGLGALDRRRQRQEAITEAAKAFYTNDAETNLKAFFRNPYLEGAEQNLNVLTGIKKFLPDDKFDELSDQLTDFIDKTKILKSEFSSFAATGAFTDNPFVQMFNDADSAALRMEKRFGTLGDEYVRLATIVEKNNIAKKFAVASYESQKNALGFEQEAFRVSRITDTQFASFHRAIDTVEKKVDFALKINDLNRQIAETDFYANQFNPNNPKSFEEMQRRFIGDDASIRNSLSDASSLKNLDLGGTGIYGAAAVASQLLKVTPSLQDLVKALNNPKLAGDARFLLNQRGQALQTTKEFEKQKLKDFLYDQETANLNRKFAREQIDLLNQQTGLSDVEKAKRLTDITKTLGNDLDPYLRRNVYQANLIAAKDEREKQTQALEYWKKTAEGVAALYEKLNNIISANGLKVDSEGQENNTTVEIIDRSNGAAKVITGAAPTPADTARHYDLGFTGGTNR